MDFSDILLTVDYDRTLTAPDSTIPQKNLEAIRYFMDNGGIFTVNTGRSIPMIRSFWDRVPHNAPFLLYNGSAAYDPASGQLSFCHEIGLDLWEMVDECTALFPDLTVEVQGLDAHYCFSENPAWEALCDHQLCSRAFAHPGDDLGPFLKLTLYGQIRDAQVSSLFESLPAEQERMDQATRLLQERYRDHCEVFRATTRIIDVHARGVSKGRSARQLQAALGRKVLVCIGDADNDLPMLTEADYAFVPGDSDLAGQFAAVCPCSEGSVADVIYNYLPKL